MNKENCGGKSCGWTGDECTCNLGWDDTKTNNEWERIIQELKEHEERTIYADSRGHEITDSERERVARSLLSSERQRLREKVDFMSIDIRNGTGDEYVKKSEILKLLEE